MSFAKPPSKASRNPTRGRPGSSNSKLATGGTRTASVSSMSSERSSHSIISIQDGAMPLDGGSSKNSRPSSVATNWSTNAEKPPADSPMSNTPVSEPEIPTGQTTSLTSTTSTPSSSSAASQPTSDALQVAAQVYPWMYMTSTLDACFKSAETAAEKDLAARTKEISEEESDISDQRARMEAERNVEFYEELASDKFATTAPLVMQAFLSHGDACTLLESEALKLATGQHAPAEEDAYSPMRPYNAMLDRLENLQREKAQLHASIVALTQEEDGVDPQEEEPSARAQMMHVFSACLPVLQARAANLQMAHELLEGAKENLAMNLHLENLEFDSDSG